MSLVAAFSLVISGSYSGKMVNACSNSMPDIIGCNFLTKVILSKVFTLLYKINVGSGLFSFACIADILNTNIGLFPLGCDNLYMLCKVDLCLEVVSGGSVNGLLPCLLLRLNSSLGFAVKSAFNQRKGNILPIVQ